MFAREKCWCDCADPLGTWFLLLIGTQWSTLASSPCCGDKSFTRRWRWQTTVTNNGVVYRRRVEPNGNRSSHHPLCLADLLTYSKLYMQPFAVRKWKGAKGQEKTADWRVQYCSSVKDWNIVASLHSNGYDFFQWNKLAERHSPLLPVAMANGSR